MNELKNHDVKDVMIICADGLSGIKDAISAAFPKTDCQRCMVHTVCNTLKYVASKDKKAFAADLRIVYNAVSEDEGLNARDRAVEKWDAKYPNSMRRWIENWDAVAPIFKFSKDVRKIIYTTNAVESLNSCYRKLNRQRSVFLVTRLCSRRFTWQLSRQQKKWTQPVHGWGQAFGEMYIMYEGRLPD